MSKSLKSIAAGGLIAAAALMGTVGIAEAHHGKGKYVIVLGGGDNPCDYYYWKWLKTGKYEWKSAYYQCIGL